MPELFLTQAPTPDSTLAPTREPALTPDSTQVSTVGVLSMAASSGSRWLLALARRRRSLRMALASVHVLKALGGPDAHSK
jgi:hypothetical protein